MEARKNQRTGLLFRRVLTLVTILLSVIQDSDADCTVGSIPADANASNNVGGKTTDYTPGQRVTFTCNSGYQVPSSPVLKTYTITCSGTTWSAASPGKCEAVMCRTNPPDITSTTKTSVTIPAALNAEVTYTCTANLAIAAGDKDFVYQCQYKTGSSFELEWRLKAGEPSSPSCQALTCPAATPDDANASKGTATGTAAGSTVTYTCKDGYQVVDGTTASKTYKRTCTSGKWGDATPASCTVLKCLTAAPNEANAKLKTGTGTAGSALNAEATYDCDTGFVAALNDNDFRKKCVQKKGSTFEAEWLAYDSKEPTKCVSFDCPSNVNARNNAGAGVIDVTKNTAKFTCNSGYQYVKTGTTTAASEFEITCTTKAWPATPDGCTAVKCLIAAATETQSTIANGNANSALGTIATYTCNKNYVIAVGDKDYKKVCQLKSGSTYEAEWVLQAGEPTKPTCREFACESKAPTRTDATAGAIDFSSTFAKLTYTCGAGYQYVTGSTAADKFTIECGSGVSAWPTTPAGCTAVKCLTKAPAETNAAGPAGGLANSALGTVAKYTCNTGFAVAPGDTDYTKVCQLKAGSTYEGDWVLDASEPAGASCQVYGCGSTAPTKTKANAGTISLKGGGQVTYTCISGYQVVSGAKALGTWTETCTGSTWSSTYTGCTAAKCLTAAATEAQATLTGGTANSALNAEAAYKCSTNYYTSSNTNTYIKVCQLKSGSAFDTEWALKAGQPTGGCQGPLDCSVPPPSRNHATAGTINFAKKSVTYACNSGYVYKSGDTTQSSFSITCTKSAWPTSPTGCVKRDLHTWEIALIATGSVLAVGGAIAAGLLYYFYQARNNPANPGQPRRNPYDDRRRLDSESPYDRYPPRDLYDRRGPPPPRDPYYNGPYDRRPPPYPNNRMVSPDFPPYTSYNKNSITQSFSRKPELPY